MFWIVLVGAVMLSTLPNLATAKDMVIYDVIPHLEQDMRACRTGADHFGKELPAAHKTAACVASIRQMTRLKELGVCHDPEQMTWSMCSALPPDWTVGVWRNSDQTAIVEILTVGFRYSWKIAEMIFTGTECAFISATEGVYKYGVECDGGVIGTMAFQSETEMSFDLNNYRKNPD